MMYLQLLLIYAIGMFPLLVAMASGIVRAARRRYATAR